MTAPPCTPGHATKAFINATGTCVCSTGYLGTQCGETLDWYFDTVIGLHVVHTLGLLFSIAWGIVLLTQSYRKRFKNSLAGLTFGLAMSSAILRVVWLVIPSSEITRFYRPSPEYVYFYSALSGISPVLLFSACATVMSLWYDVWTRKIRKGDNEHLTKRSKILLIGLAVITVICASIGVALLQPITNFLLIFLPLLANTILLIVYTAIIRRFKTSGFRSAFREKHAWASKVFIVIVSALSLYTIALFLQILFELLAVGIFSIICHFFYRTLEPLIAISVMFLLDPYASVLMAALPCTTRAARTSQSMSTTTTSSEQTPQVDSSTAPV